MILFPCQSGFSDTKQSKTCVTFLLQHASSKVTKACVSWAWYRWKEHGSSWYLSWRVAPSSPRDPHSAALLHALGHALFNFYTCSLRVEKIFLKNSKSKCCPLMLGSKRRKWCVLQNGADPAEFTASLFFFFLCEASRLGSDLNRTPHEVRKAERAVPPR